MNISTQCTTNLLTYWFGLVQDSLQTPVDVAQTAELQQLMIARGVCGKPR
jgi:hypothetical protein